MNARLHHTRAAPPGRRRRRLVAELALGLLPLLAVAGATTWRFALPPGYLLRAVALYGLLAVLLYRQLPAGSRSGLGPANRVTLTRAGLVLAIAALLPHPALASSDAGWWVITLATLSLLLDGVDGQVARRTGSATAFGARFDMELDALLMLALALAVWRSGRLGPWVVLLGLPRYVFVAAGWRWRWLRRPLPERLRRKAGCVMQGVALLVSLAPIVPRPLAAGVSGTALLLLVSSFLVDAAWLHRTAPRTGRIE